MLRLLPMLRHESQWFDPVCRLLLLRVFLRGEWAICYVKLWGKVIQSSETSSRKIS
jgi:hypothetical protein